MALHFKMRMKKRVMMSWSTGKDAALTLCRLLKNDDYLVVGLFTTYVKDKGPFQETPLDILKAQAQSMGLSLILIELNEVFPSPRVYQKKVIEGIIHSGLNVEALAFGDIFCNGIERYRKDFIEPQGLECLFPLLDERTFSLAQEIIQTGIKTSISMVETSQLHSSFLGRDYNPSLLSSLPFDFDPCGEKGEFHTLVTDAPCFSFPLQLIRESDVKEGRFHYSRFLLEDRNAKIH